MYNWRIKWSMRIEYSKWDVRVYQWIENEHGESAFIWFYESKEW